MPWQQTFPITRSNYAAIVGQWKVVAPLQPQQKKIAPITQKYGDQPPRSSNVNLFNIVRQWPEVKQLIPYQPYPPRYIAPQTLVYGDQPRPRSVTNLMLLRSLWPEDKEPRLWYPNYPLQVKVAPLIILPSAQVPSGMSKTVFHQLIQSWMQKYDNPQGFQKNAAWNILVPIAVLPEGAWWPWGVGWIEPERPKKPKKLLKELTEKTLELQRVETLIPVNRIKLAFTMLAALKLAEGELTVKELRKVEALHIELITLYHRSDERLKRLAAEDDDWLIFM